MEVVDWTGDMGCHTPTSVPFPKAWMALPTKGRKEMIIGFLSRKPNPGKLSYFMAQMHDNPRVKSKTVFCPNHNYRRVSGYLSFVITSLHYKFTTPSKT